MADSKLVQAVESYFTDLRLVRGSGGATDERSLYVPLANLLDAVGATLRPKVFCVQDLANQGVGHPDFGLYTAQQVQKGKPKSGPKPERGVIEVKPVADDAWLTAASDQVTAYWQGYRQVLATNFRDFVLVGEDADGHPARCGWSGRVSRCPAGPMATPRVRRIRWSCRRPGAGIWRRCWTPTPPSPA